MYLNVFVEITSDVELQTTTTKEITGEYNTTAPSEDNKGNLITPA